MVSFFTKKSDPRGCSQRILRSFSCRSLRVWLQNRVVAHYRDCGEGSLKTLSKGISIVSPVMAILQDHLLVPSRTICSACSRLSMCVSGSTENVVLKRRQCPRHRIVLRQPLVPFSSHFTLFRDSSRDPLEAARKCTSYGGHRRTRGYRETESRVHNHPTSSSSSSSSSSDGSMFSSAQLC